MWVWTSTPQARVSGHLFLLSHSYKQKAFLRTQPLLYHIPSSPEQAISGTLCMSLTMSVGFSTGSGFSLGGTPKQTCLGT